jgi:hypothetical protein
MLMAGLLIGACLLALAVGVLNILSLLSARMVSRSRELSIQTALGATPGRLAVQLLGESALLSAGGGTLALALTWLSTSWISAYRPPLPVPLAFDVVVDARVMGFAVALTLAAAGLIALSQLRHLRRRHLTNVAQVHIGRFAAGRSRRHWLLAPQVAGSVILLVLAALLTRSVGQAARVDPGFTLDGVGMLTFSPGTSGLDETDARRFFDQLVDVARSQPGVAYASVADRIPLDPYGSRSVAVAANDGAPSAVQAADVTPDYFDALTIPLRAGRVFDSADLAGAPQTAVVNDAFARAWWPGASAIGRTLDVDGRAITVAGVVETSRCSHSESPQRRWSICRWRAAIAA